MVKMATAEMVAARLVAAGIKMQPKDTAFADASGRSGDAARVCVRACVRACCVCVVCVRPTVAGVTAS